MAPRVAIPQVSYSFLVGRFHRAYNSCRSGEQAGETVGDSASSAPGPIYRLRAPRVVADTLVPENKRLKTREIEMVDQRQAWKIKRAEK